MTHNKNGQTTDIFKCSIRLFLLTTQINCIGDRWIVCCFPFPSLAISNIAPRSARDNLDVIDFCFVFSLCFHKPPCTEAPLSYCRTQWRNAPRKSDWFRLIELSKYHNFGAAFLYVTLHCFCTCKIRRKMRKTSQKLIEFSTVRCTLRKWLKTLWHSGISSIYCCECVENRRNRKWLNEKA